MGRLINASIGDEAWGLYGSIRIEVVDEDKFQDACLRISRYFNRSASLKDGFLRIVTECFSASAFYIYDDVDYLKKHFEEGVDGFASLEVMGIKVVKFTAINIDHSDIETDF